MSFRQHARRILARLRAEASRAASIASEVAEAMLRPTPQINGQQPTAIVLDDPIVTLDGRRLPNVERVIVHKTDVGPGTSWHELPPDEAAIAERVRRDHVRRHSPGMY